MPQKRRSSVLFNEYVILNAPVDSPGMEKKVESCGQDKPFSTINGHQWKIYDLVILNIIIDLFTL